MTHYERQAPTRKIMDAADALLQRGARLRELRRLEKEDEAERQGMAASNRHELVDDASGDQENDGESGEDEVILLSSGATLLRYDMYLRHQKYYDDLKHIDHKFIDFGVVGPGQLIVEQDKTLGKGGLCWDAAFILGEYVVQTIGEWAKAGADDNVTRIIELGSGTGLAGLLVAKAVENVHVTLTDLPALIPLMNRNLSRNFAEAKILSRDSSVHQRSLELFIETDLQESMQKAGFNDSKGYAEISVLDWDNHTAEKRSFDVILGADVVATLYDPVALAKTIHWLSNMDSIVAISFKERLSTIHRRFEVELTRLFASVEVIDPRGTSRNENPDVRVIVARNKI